MGYLNALAIISLAFVIGASASDDQGCPTTLGDPEKIFGYVFGKQHPNYSPLQPQQTLDCLKVIYEHRGNRNDIGSQVLDLIQVSKLNSSDECWQTDIFKTFEELIMFHEIKQHTLNVIPYLFHYEEAQFKLSHAAATRALESRLESIPEDRVERLRRFMLLLAESETPVPEWPYFRINWPTLLNGTYQFSKEYINQVEDRRLKLNAYTTAFGFTIGNDCRQVDELFAVMFAHFRPLLSGSRRILKRFNPSLVEWLKIASVCGRLINSEDLVIKETYEIIMANVKDNNILSKLLQKFIRV